MINYEIKKEQGKTFLETNVHGKALLSIAQLNKGTAFTQEERENFNLIGKLPYHVETLDEQVERAYQQFRSYDEQLNRNIYLCNILNTNMTLYYKLIKSYLLEMMPTVYTPIVGTAVQSFNRKFRQPRGLYISYPDRDKISEILDNRTHPTVELIVVSDGQGVLGIGDQGISAMDIPVAKLTVYTAFANINPLKNIPIVLDVGTDNEELLNDPLYLGWRHPRIKGDEYRKFIALFVETVKEKFPKVLLHWEDFGRDNAHYNLTTYRDKILSFNDDIQGTGTVCLAAILSAIQKTEFKTLKEQRIIIYGGGTAGIGVINVVYEAMLREGLSEQEALDKIWIIDRHGLLLESSPGITYSQQPFLKKTEQVANWSCSDKHHITLFETVKHVKPTILIGCSTHHNAFNQATVKEMANHVDRPIIFPLSNPNEKSEANPAELYRWTNGKVLTATGSPFPGIEENGKTIHFSQCNNYLAFPGIGLGASAIQAESITDDMLHIASLTLCEFIQDDPHLLLPRIDQAEEFSFSIACAVAKQAIKEGVAKEPKIGVEEAIKQHQWQPAYLPYKKIEE